MQCPKCSAENLAGAEECASCGIIFSRWRERSSQPPLPEVDPAAVEFTPAPAGIPSWAIVVAAVVIVLLGITWTRHARSQRAARDADPDALLNQINAKGVEFQKRKQAEFDSLRAAAHNAELAEKAKGGVWPVGLDRDQAAEVIGRCDYFGAPVSVRIPREFARSSFGIDDETTKILRAAENEGLIQFSAPADGSGGFERSTFGDGSTVTVFLTSRAHTEADVVEGRDDYTLGVGARKLSSISGVQVIGDRATVSFSWDFERPVGAAIIPDSGSRRAYVEFTRDRAVWLPASISVIGDGGLHTRVCTY